jgi:hypothetical protein
MGAAALATDPTANYTDDRANFPRTQSEPTPPCPIIVHDFLGVSVQVGDTIVYPNRQGSSMWLRKGTVRKLEATRDAYNRRTVVATLEVPRHDWNWETHRREEIGTKTVPFSSFSRCVVVSKALAN